MTEEENHRYFPQSYVAEDSVGSGDLWGTPHKSCPMPWLLACGIPHGSILFPMLFNINMKSLGGVV